MLSFKEIIEKVQQYSRETLAVDGHKSQQLRTRLTNQLKIDILLMIKILTPSIYKQISNTQFVAIAVEAFTK